MIKPATRALAKDALYQVLDNGVFRILAIAALLPVLIFSVIRVTADEFQLLFGMKSWDLNYMAAMAAPEGSSDPQASVLGFLLDQVFFSFPGTFGVLFCLCAASFFVPKMLEKGAVDVIFHKPISRTRFFLSRYVTGLLFVALLTSVSATGVFLALLLVSGFTDVGVFAVIPAMTYLFGVIYPVTMVVGLLTRSTVAALLLSAVFYLLNGAIQVTWISIEISSQDALSQLSSGSGLEVTIETSGGESTDEDSADFQEDEDEANVWLDAALMTLDIAHFSLPKTTDVSFLTAKFRRATSRSVWSDEDSLLQLGELPEEWSSLLPVGSSAADEGFPLLDSFESTGAMAFAATGPAGESLALYLRPKKIELVTRSNGTTRERRERLRDASKALLQELTSVAGVSQAQEIDFQRVSRVQNPFDTQDTSEDGLTLKIPFLANLIAWSESDSEEPHVRALIFSNGEQFGILIHRSKLEDPLEEGFREVLANLGYANESSAYGKLLSFESGWRTNILTSIGSSLLFVLLVLGFGAWRLNRYDF